MASSGARIQALPPDVAAKIKSSISITDLNGVILELVKNALDANASTVHISVDFKRGGCIVEDDGDGIRSVEFESTGGLGKAHHTSHFQKTDKYGHRGLFLSALSALSLLTVTSCHVHQRTTNSVIFHRSAPVARLVPAPAHQNLRFSGHGTCVTVNDLFGNMPVRVKRRALALERPEELDREWDNLRFSLASLMLANPLLLKLVLSDAERGKRVSIRLDRSIKSDHADVANEVDLRRIGSILAQWGMINSRNMDSWHVISANIPDLTICAAISTVPSPSRKLQFISLGNDPVLSSGSNLLFNEINRLIALSDFGVSGNLSRSTTATCASPVPGHSEPPSSISGKTWAKPVNKWPMFYIRIETSTTLHMSDGGDEIFPSSDKSFQRVTDLLKAMILEFLKQQNMRPRITKRQGRISDRAQEGSSVGQTRSSSSSKQRGAGSSTEEGFSNNLKLPSFQRPQSSNLSQNLNNWSRVKTAKRLDTRPTPSRDTANRLGGHLLSLPERPQSRSGQEKNATSSLLHTSLGQSKEAGQDEIEDESQTTDRLIPWTNHRTGKTHMINSRTGQMVEPMVSSSFTRRTLPRLGNTQANPSSPKVWVENLLKAWDNPTFARTEMPLLGFFETDYFNPEASSRNCHHEIGTLEAAQVHKFQGKLQRQSLSKATIIAQVDQKYIFAKLGAAPSQSAGMQETVLVLIDQHAADERCRIEQLFEEMFITTELPYETKVRTVDINPIVFKISSTEATLFHKYSSFFRDWGIYYDMGETSESESTVLVHLLPALIAERCRLEPTLVVELLRREIWTKEEGGSKPLGAVMESADSHPESHGMSLDEGGSFPMETNTPHSWVQKMSGCPQGIFDLLNSRACRGAIMFNDPLSIDDCEILVSRLARCAFPFQCAHGRPSMIPILDLRPRQYHADSFDGGMAVDCDDYDDYDDSGMNFTEAFQAKYTH
ncbi:hypothetical protein N7486_010141 [Penicillium sp. IBT 16267x]|nr:hypothetical protein N7486_010141 [Penicillium sp. IBT 16267x]